MAQSEICSQLYFLVPPIISYLFFFPRIHITTIIKNLISLEDLQVGSLSIHLSRLKLFSHRRSAEQNISYYLPTIFFSKNSQIYLRILTPVDLYLISEKSIWKSQVRWTGFLVYFKLDFYCLRSLQKSGLSNLILPTWFFKIQVKINSGWEIQ